LCHPRHQVNGHLFLQQTPVVVIHYICLVLIIV
jgi:hypothetical protein